MLTSMIASIGAYAASSALAPNVREPVYLKSISETAILWGGTVENKATGQTLGLVCLAEPETLKNYPAVRCESYELWQFVQARGTKRSETVFVPMSRLSDTEELDAKYSEFAEEFAAERTKDKYKPSDEVPFDQEDDLVKLGLTEYMNEYALPTFYDQQIYSEGLLTKRAYNNVTENIKDGNHTQVGTALRAPLYGIYIVGGLAADVILIPLITATLSVELGFINLKRFVKRQVVKTQYKRALKISQNVFKTLTSPNALGTNYKIKDKYYSAILETL